jgi:T4 RnlA family RNA ligase
MKTLNIQLLETMIADGYINRQKHPHAQLYVYNYSQKTQYDYLWNEITMACRGLITDETYNIVARPFEKFFNIGEIQNQILPNESFDVFEKMDGSLGILYWVNDAPAIATRGSFTSEQALKATEILHQKYAHLLESLNRSKTYLFEIIYPQNRIVLDYGHTEDIILLAIIDTFTGNSEPLQGIGFTIVPKYDGIQDLQILHQLKQDNKEGFVIQYKNGYRVKVKFAEYLRLHRIVTQISNLTIWEHLMNELPFDELLERVPDEFYNWVKKVKADLQAEFNTIENICKQEFKTLPTQKETALYFITCTYPKVLFLMMNKKKYDAIIWKMIRPTFSKPFQNKD